MTTNGTSQPLKILRAGSLAVLLALPAASHAQTFTFKSTSKLIDRVQLPAATQGGRPTGAGVSTVEVDTTYADGKTTHQTGKCAQWILPPGAPFGSNSACTYSDASGEVYTAQFTCEAPNQGPNCWGKLVGTGGAFKGRTGAFTLRGGPSGAVGAGLWND